MDAHIQMCHTHVQFTVIWLVEILEKLHFHCFSEFSSPYTYYPSELQILCIANERIHHSGKALVVSTIYIFYCTYLFTVMMHEISRMFLIEHVITAKECNTETKSDLTNMWRRRVRREVLTKYQPSDNISFYSTSCNLQDPTGGVGRDGGSVVAGVSSVGGTKRWNVTSILVIT